LPTMGADTIWVRQQQVVNDYTTSRATRYLPQVAVATTVVAVLPIVIVWWLHADGLISSPWALVALAIVLSLTASVAGSAYWKRHSGANDVFFSELLLWGWLHRFLGERRLARAVGSLGLDGTDPPLPQSNVNPDGRAQMLKQMAAAVDAQDRYTDGHSRRVALHTAMVARRMGLSREQVSRIRTAAAVHDIGKLRIPSEVLNKPGQLTASERELVERHADEGAAIVDCMDDPDVTAMVRHHHERFDGQGYPAGLAGEQIPLGARIIAVADTFDALTSIRPYRGAIPHKKALDVLVEGSGTQLDPVAVRAFLKCYTGNRALLFWTLLLISPQRAVDWLRGKAHGHGNLASASSAAAAPAAVVAAVAIAIGPSTSAASRYPLRLAQRTSAPVAVGVIPSRNNGPRRVPHRTSKVGGRRSAGPSRQAVLGVTSVRSHTRGALRHHPTSHRSVAGAPSGLGGGRSRSQATGGSRGAGGGRRGAGAGGKPGRGSTGVRHGGGKGTPVAAPGVPAGGGPGGAPPATPTGSQTSGPGAPSASGAPGGTAAPPVGNGPGGSGGGPGGGGAMPTKKDQCKNGGWMHYPFPNQGQCVAFVERGQQ
jgi:HD-GYP domain-containing protein (c-di-GMP phosphodiesterase class II)